MNQYRDGMKKAVRSEIVKRFGDTDFEAINAEGAVPYGTPFLFQDAAGLTVDKLLTDKDFKERVEVKRKEISGDGGSSEKQDTVTIAVNDLSPVKVEEYIPIKEGELIVYGDLKIEGRAFRKSGSSKELMTFDESDRRIKKSGLQRHLRPNEAFGLMIDGLEGKLNGSLKSVNKDMLESYGEWLSLAVERKGDILVAYLDPEGLVWRDGRYIKEDFKFADKIEFDTEGKPSQQWLRMRDFNKAFVKFMYGRDFKDLPELVQKEAHVYLPPNAKIWPVGRGFDFSVDGYGCGSWASRGVVVSQKFST